jgi:hypothetical protein
MWLACYRLDRCHACVWGAGIVHSDKMEGGRAAAIESGRESAFAGSKWRRRPPRRLFWGRAVGVEGRSVARLQPQSLSCGGGVELQFRACLSVLVCVCSARAEMDARTFRRRAAERVRGGPLIARRHKCASALANLLQNSLVGWPVLAAKIFQPKISTPAVLRYKPRFDRRRRACLSVGFGKATRALQRGGGGARARAKSSSNQIARAPPAGQMSPKADDEQQKEKGRKGEQQREGC